MTAKTVWHREDIKAAVRKRGTTFFALSLANGLNHNACATALQRHHAKGEEAIAAFLGVSPQDLWPHRFDPVTGERLKVPRPLDLEFTRNPPQRQRQKGVAA